MRPCDPNLLRLSAPIGLKHRGLIARNNGKVSLTEAVLCGAGEALRATCQRQSHKSDLEKLARERGSHLRHLVWVDLRRLGSGLILWMLAGIPRALHRAH